MRSGSTAAEKASIGKSGTRTNPMTSVPEDSFSLVIGHSGLIREPGGWRIWSISWRGQAQTCKRNRSNGESRRRHSSPEHMTDRFLAGRTAWVTGGASGMGRATALRLAEAGADVAVGSLVMSQRAVAVKDQNVHTPDDEKLAETKSA